MKNLKKLATTLALTGIIMMGVSSAKAGLLLSDFTGNNGQQCNIKVNVDSGILLGDFVGIIVSGFTGIIVSGISDSGCVQVDNGILLGD